MIKLDNSDNNLTREDIDKFQKEFNLELPESYILFMLKHNGGYPNLKAYGNPYEDGSIIDSFYSISTIDYEFRDDTITLLPSREIIKTHQLQEHNIPSFLYPFADDEGSGKFCISMKQENFGKIYMVFLDRTSDEPIYLCNSFDEFINGLDDLEKYEE